MGKLIVFLKENLGKIEGIEINIRSLNLALLRSTEHL